MGRFLEKFSKEHQVSSDPWEKKVYDAFTRAGFECGMAEDGSVSEAEMQLDDGKMWRAMCETTADETPKYGGDVWEMLLGSYDAIDAEILDAKKLELRLDDSIDEMVGKIKAVVEQREWVGKEGPRPDKVRNMSLENAPETVQRVKVMDPNEQGKRRDQMLDQMLKYPEGSPERAKAEERLRSFGAGHMELKVVAISNSPNSFGLFGIVMIGRDGSAWMAARGQTVSPLKIGDIVKIRTGYGGDLDWASLGFEIPEKISPAPSSELMQQIWPSFELEAPETVQQVKTMGPKEQTSRRDQMLDGMLKLPEGSPERKKMEEKLRAFGEGSGNRGWRLLRGLNAPGVEAYTIEHKNLSAVVAGNAERGWWWQVRSKTDEPVPGIKGEEMFAVWQDLANGEEGTEEEAKNAAERKMGLAGPETVQDVPVIKHRDKAKRRDQMLDQMLKFPEGAPEREQAKERLKSLGWSRFAIKMAAHGPLENKNADCTLCEGRGWFQAEDEKGRALIGREKCERCGGTGKTGNVKTAEETIIDKYWISPEGEKIHNGMGATHQEWAYRFLKEKGDLKTSGSTGVDMIMAANILLDAGYIRVQLYADKGYGMNANDEAIKARGDVVKSLMPGAKRMYILHHPEGNVDYIDLTKRQKKVKKAAEGL